MQKPQPIFKVSIDQTTKNPTIIIDNDVTMYYFSMHMELLRAAGVCSTDPVSKTSTYEFQKQGGVERHKEMVEYLKRCTWEES